MVLEKTEEDILNNGLTPMVSERTADDVLNISIAPMVLVT
jgi:hypothetical protein